MILKILEGNFEISKINDINSNILSNEFVFLGITDQEISLVCKEEFTPNDTLSKASGYILIRIEGVLDFSLVGILAKISSILAKNQISIFVISTFNTDYFLIEEKFIEKTKSILIENGYQFK